MSKKSNKFKISFNSLEINENDPTILQGKVIVHDFEKSWNNQVISEEVCQENLSTLIGKRISCHYINEEENNGVDALTDHEEYIGKNREGNEVILTQTEAVGFFKDAYIDNYTDKNGTEKRGLVGEVVIWNDDHYQNVASLLLEWLEKGIQVHMSVEYLYVNYDVRDGIEFIQSPLIYVNHVLLNSEERENYAEIQPAFDDAQLLSLNQRKQWNKALNSLKTKNSKQENTTEENVIDNKKNNSQNEKEERGIMAENRFRKALNDISFGGIREKLYDDLADKLVASEYFNIYISMWDVYDDYFTYDNYEDNEWVLYRMNYTKDENDQVTVDVDSKHKIERKVEYVPVIEVETVQVSLNAKEEELKTANAKITELEGSLSTEKETVKTLNSKVTELETEKSNNSKDDKEDFEKLTQLNETIIALNSQIKEMQPMVDGYKAEIAEKAQLEAEKALNSVKEQYKIKFKSVNALEEFNSEEVQDLIEKTLNSDESVSMKAKYELGEKIVNHVSVKDENELNKSVNSKTNDENDVDDMQKSLNSKGSTLTPCNKIQDLDKHFGGKYDFDLE